MKAYRILSYLFALLTILELAKATNYIFNKNNPINEVCVNGKYHKTKASKEDNLHQCGEWNNNACCNSTTTIHAYTDQSPLYGLNYSHCGQKISDKCLARFGINMCFYECSPNLAPWIVSVKSSYRSERFVGVPLCESECNAWWEDCKDELTCVENWSLGFDWRNGTNHCPVNSTCQTFSKTYLNSTYFCEHLFPKDFVVTKDTQPCMKLNTPQRNKDVVEYYAVKKHLLAPKETKFGFLYNQNNSVNDQCMLSPSHKPKPSKEDNLFKCNAYDNNACCNSTTAQHAYLDSSPLHGLNYSHCGRDISSKCLSRFGKAMCFFQCSSNLAPWIVAVKSSYRSERFVGVPLCESECNAWWEDCKDELTCVENWSLGFDWRNGSNQCPTNSECRTFTKTYQNAQYFCEHLFPNVYVVKKDQYPCMKFDSPISNANVTDFYARELHLKASNGDLISPYFPPSSTPPLQVHGTIISLVFAILILIAVIVLVGYLVVKRYRGSMSFRGGIPVPLRRSTSRHSTSHIVMHTDREAEMSFMQYDDEEEEEEEDLKMNGTLQMDL